MTQWIRRPAGIIGIAAASLCGGAIVVTLAAQQPPAARSAAQPKPPNILLIIGDDMGIETLRSFGVGADTAATPNLDRLAASGVRFNRYFSQPVCSPTRATMLTGRYGFRTGVGLPTGDGSVAGPMPPTPPVPAGSPREGGRGQAAASRGRPGGAGAGRGGAGQGDAAAQGAPGLRLDEFTLPKAFSAHPELGYATAVIGKWHLADRSNGWEKHPNLAGFEHFSGGLRGFPEGYFGWVKDVNGTLSGATGYGASD